MLGMVEISNRYIFNDLALIEHHNPVSDQFRKTHIVGH